MKTLYSVHCMSELYGEQPYLIKTETMAEAIHEVCRVNDWWDNSKVTITITPADYILLPISGEDND